MRSHPLLSWLRRYLPFNRQASSKRPKAPVAKKSRPLIEELEFRAMPSTIPFAFINNTGKPDSSIHIALFGQDVTHNSTNNPHGFFYVDKDGASQPLYGSTLPYLATTALTSNLTVSDNQVTVNSTAGFPTSYVPNFPILIDSEVMLVVGPGSGNATWNVVRNYNGAGAANHTASAAVKWDEQYVPNFTLDQLTNGTLNLPSNATLVSGRMLFGVDSDVFAQIVTNDPQNLGGATTLGVSAPAANSASDPNFKHTYDFFELTLQNGAINGNLTQIDQFGMPIQLQLTPPDMTDAPHGVGAVTSRSQIISNNSTLEPGYTQFVQNTPFTLGITAAPVDTNGTPYRILSPADVLTLYPVYYQPATFTNGCTTAYNLITTNVLTPGMSVSGANITPGTTIAGIQPPTVVTGNTTINSTTVGALSSTVGLRPGMVASTPAQIPPGTTIASVNTSLSCLTLSANATATANATTLTFIDLTAISLSNATTGNQTNTSLTFKNPNFDTSSLANYFNGVIQQLFETGNQTLTLTVPNPNSGQNTTAQNPVNPGDPANYTFSGTRSQITVPNMLSVNQTYNVLSFNGTVANQTITFQVYEPLFSSNTANASYPLAPKFLTVGTNTIASGLETPGSMVFGCDGVFADNTLQFPGSCASLSNQSLANLKSNLLGNIENQIVSALNRGVALRPTSEWHDINYFYTHDDTYNPNNIWNYYAQYFHQDYVSIDGKTYGFAYDDQAGQSSDFGQNPIQGMLITLGSWNTTVNVTPPAQTVAPNSTLAFTTVTENSISLQSSASGNLTVNLLATSGNFNFTQYNGVVASGIGTANLTLNGTVSALNGALATLTYNAGGTPGTNKVQMTTGNGCSTLDTDSFFIQVQTLSNTAPINVYPGNQTLPSNASFQFSEANGNAIQVIDPDAGLGNVTMNLLASNGTLAIARAHNTTYTGYGTNNLTITGRLDNLNKALDTLFYQPAATGNFTLTITSSDNGNSGSGGGKSDTDIVNLIVKSPSNHTNSGPKIYAPYANQTITPTVAFPFSTATKNAISISDTDAGYKPVQLTLTAAQGLINFGSVIGLTFMNGTLNNSGTVIVQGRVDHINYDLQSLTYTSLPSFTGSDNLVITVNDLGNSGGGGAKSATKTVHLVGTPLPPNVGPVNTVPGPQVAVAGKSLLFSAANGNAITVADADAGSHNLLVTLKTNVGTLAIGASYGVVFTGQGTNNLTLNGTLENLNKTLDVLFYQPTAAAGSATLTIITNDLGSNGSGGAKIDTDTVPITVQTLANHVDIAPTATSPVATQNVTMNGTLNFGPLFGNTIAAGDLDSGYDSVQVTLTVSHGTVNVTTFQGGPIVTGNGTGTLMLLGRIDHLNYVLRSLLYKPVTSYTGADLLNININDQSKNGTGGPKTANASVNIQVS